MYVVVVGCGKVGFYLVRQLLEEGHEVLVLERDPATCETAREELGEIVVRGDGCEAKVLSEVGTGRADMLVAATGDDEDNLVACQVAKHMFQVPRTVARVRDPRNEEVFKRLGIDVTVSATSLILEKIEHEVPTHHLVHLLTLRAGELEVVEVKIPPDSAAVGRKLKDVPIPAQSVVSVVVGKEGGARAASRDTVLQAGDAVIAVTHPDDEVALRDALAAPPTAEGDVS